MNKLVWFLQHASIAKMQCVAGVARIQSVTMDGREVFFSESARVATLQGVGFFLTDEGVGYDIKLAQCQDVRSCIKPNESGGRKAGQNMVWGK
jgi:hypothetical protein